MNNKYLPVVYLNDKDIYDALMSSKKKITNEILIEMMKKRGILLSEYSSREKLIEYISIMNHSIVDYNFITDFLQIANRTEKTTSFSIETEMSVEELKTSFDELKNDRSHRDEVFTLQAVSQDLATIRVDYTELDFSKTTLKQRRPREAEIEIEKSDGVITFRAPANDRITEITNVFVQKIESIKKESLSPKKINLSGIISPLHRTMFFLKLINALDDFKHDTVIFVDVHSDFQTSSSEDYFINDDEEKIIAQELLCYVKKASMNGIGLLQSSEYQHLTDRGFFINNIIWHSIEKKQKGMKIEFQALLNDPRNGLDFRYTVKGGFNPSRSGDGFTNTKRPLNDNEKAYYIKLLEKAAHKAYDETIIEYKKEIEK